MSSVLKFQVTYEIKFIPLLSVFFLILNNHVYYSLTGIFSKEPKFNMSYQKDLCSISLIQHISHSKFLLLYFKHSLLESSPPTHLYYYSSVGVSLTGNYKILNVCSSPSECRSFVYSFISTLVSYLSYLFKILVFSFDIKFWLRRAIQIACFLFDCMHIQSTLFSKGPPTV